MTVSASRQHGRNDGAFPQRVQEGPTERAVANGV